MQIILEKQKHFLRFFLGGLEKNDYLCGLKTKKSDELQTIIISHPDGAGRICGSGRECKKDQD
jgi:hypothetical protein